MMRVFTLCSLAVSGLLTGAWQSLECRVINLLMNSNVPLEFLHLGNKRDSKYQSTFTKVVFCQTQNNNKRCSGEARVAFVSALAFYPGKRIFIVRAGLGCD